MFMKSANFFVILMVKMNNRFFFIAYLSGIFNCLGFYATIRIELHFREKIEMPQKMWDFMN